MYSLHLPDKEVTTPFLANYGGRIKLNILYPRYYITSHHICDSTLFILIIIPYSQRSTLSPGTFLTQLAGKKRLSFYVIEVDRPKLQLALSELMEYCIRVVNNSLVLNVIEG